MTGRESFFRLLKYMSKYKVMYGVLIITMLIGIIIDLSTAWYLSIVSNAAG